MTPDETHATLHRLDVLERVVDIQQQTLDSLSVSVGKLAEATKALADAVIAMRQPEQERNGRPLW